MGKHIIMIPIGLSGLTLLEYEFGTIMRLSIGFLILFWEKKSMVVLSTLVRLLR